jgi:hypothetical protein
MVDAVVVAEIAWTNIHFDALARDAALPWLAIRELTLEDFSERCIIEAIEAPDRIELPHIDVAIGHASRIDVEKDDLADDERVSIGAKLNDLMQPALEMDRDLFDPRHVDPHTADRSEPGLGKLRIFLGDGVRAVNHLPPHRLCHQVDAKLTGLPYMF